MTLQDLGNLGEFLGAIGVIVTLVYLTTQIRQNTRALRSSSVQAANLSIGRAISLIGQSPQNAEVFHRGLRSFEDLSEEQQTHFTFMMGGVFANCDAMYWDRRQGILPPEVWEREEALLKFYLSTPGGLRVWQLARGVSVSQPFAALVDEKLLRGDAPAGPA